MHTTLGWKEEGRKDPELRRWESQEGKGLGRKDLKEGHQICDQVVTDGFEICDALRGADERKKWKEAKLHRVSQK